MIEVISKSTFCNNERLRQNFSYEGLSALYDFIEEVNAAYELDAVELCCEYTEGTIEDALNDYDFKSMDELRDQTCVVWEDKGRVLYQQF